MLPVDQRFCLQSTNALPTRYFCQFTLKKSLENVCARGLERWSGWKCHLQSQYTRAASSQSSPTNQLCRIRKSPWRFARRTLSPPEVRKQCRYARDTDRTILTAIRSRRRCCPYFSRSPRYGQDDPERKGGDDYHKRRQHYAQEHVSYASHRQDAGQSLRCSGC